MCRADVTGQIDGKGDGQTPDDAYLEDTAIFAEKDGYGYGCRTQEGEDEGTHELTQEFRLEVLRSDDSSHK